MTGASPWTRGNTHPILLPPSRRKLRANQSTSRDRDVLFNAGFKRDSRKALEETTDLEHTSFHNGFFLDYWCMPAVKSHMTPWTVVVDMASNAAVLPGSGNVNVTFTHTSDVGRYVAAWLDVREWEPRTFLVGETVTWNQFLAIAEDVKGM